jgi:hypothetical protein
VGSGREDLILVFEAETERQFMPFSTLWIVRSATLAFRASCAWVINRFSRSSRTRFCRIVFDRLFSIPSHSLRPTSHLDSGVRLDLAGVSTGRRISLEKIRPWRIATQPAPPPPKPFADRQIGQPSALERPVPEAEVAFTKRQPRGILMACATGSDT